jgi:hypothetical protein
MNRKRDRSIKLKNNSRNIKKINPLVEKKLENLYDERKNLVNSYVKNNSRKTKVKLDIINLKIKNLVRNGTRGLKNSTRKIMNNL